MSSPSGSFHAAPEAAPLYLTFDDNNLLGALFGEHDRHLARIEQKLGVSMTSRGNRLAVTGPSLATNTARDVLLDLYGILERGLPVGAQEVDAALRISDGPASVHPLVVDDRL